MLYRLNFLPLCSLLLLSGCIDFRSLPTDDPLVFAAHFQDPQEQYFKPGEEVALKLSLTSEEEALREEPFHVLSATLDDGTDVLAHVTHDALTLQENTLHYTPQSPGEHTLRLRLGLSWEVEGAQETTCRIHVPAAEWRVRGKVDAAGALSFKVDGVDERWREEQWTLLPQRVWSEGVAGTLHNLSGEGDVVWDVEEEETLRHGVNNDLTVNLTASSLQDPQVRFTVQGPDEATQEVNVDLLPLCIAKLKDGMGELERTLAYGLPEVWEHVQAAEELYVLDEETVLDANRNREKVREVEERLATMERDKADYDRDLARLETLDQQDPEHASRQLPAFRSAQKRLEDAIRCLKSTQVQLQAQCTTAHEALNKVVRTGENRQEERDILLEDPRLEVNARVRDENNQEETLLSAAVGANDAIAVTKLLERGAEVAGDLRKCMRLTRDRCLSLPILQRTKDVLLCSLQRGECFLAFHEHMANMLENIHFSDHVMRSIIEMNENILPAFRNDLGIIRAELAHWETLGERSINQYNRHGELPLHDAVRNSDSSKEYISFLAERTEVLGKDLNEYLGPGESGEEDVDYYWDYEGDVPIFTPIPRTFLDMAESCRNQNAVEVFRTLGLSKGIDLY